jgi:hypothetical protein
VSSLSIHRHTSGMAYYPILSSISISIEALMLRSLWPGLTGPTDQWGTSENVLGVVFDRGPFGTVPMTRTWFGGDLSCRSDVAQWYWVSPLALWVLFLARTKCSLWDDPLPLRRGGSFTTAYNLEPGHQQILQGDHRAPNATKPSRWCRSPRVTSYRLSLDQEKPNACGVCSRWLSLALMRS